MYLPLHAGADFNGTQPFEITMPAQTTAAGGSIPIFDDEINEGAQEFVVVLEVVSVTTNPVTYSVCVLKGPKLSSNRGFIFAKKLCKLLCNVFSHKCTI